MDTNNIWRECNKCRKKLASYKTLWQHKKTCKYSCSKGKMLMNTVDNKAATTVEENNHQRPKDSRLSSFIDDIINKKPESENAMIQPLKSTPMSYAEQNMVDPSLSNKEPVEEILSVHETAKKLNIIPESDESSDDESIVEHPSPKKRKLKDADDAPLTITDVHNVSKDDNLSQGNENIDNKREGKDENEENEDVSDYDMDNNDDTVLGEGSDNEDESDNDDDENISKHELKSRLHRSVNNLKMFELDLDADKALSNIDLLEYIDILKVPKFRGVFMRDELPKRINPVECGIVNLSPHEQLGTHWVCYAKVHKTRIYFDSFGRKTPLEIQKYMKTAEEFRNDTPVIERSTDIVQRVNTKICGHLCLFVLTSLMRERLSYQRVKDQLNDAFSEYYY